MIRTAHRIAAALLALSMLHLNIAGADLACAKHGAHERGDVGHAMAAAVGDDAMPGMSHTAPTVREHGKNTAHAEQSLPCETPTVPACCQALASCSQQFGLRRETNVGRYLTGHEGRPLGVVGVPLVRFTAPEPPPPKA